MTTLFLTYYWRRFIRYFKTRRLAKGITAFLFLGTFFSVALGIFLFSQKGFLLIAKDPYLKTAMPLYVYELFLLIIFYLVFVSALVTGLFALFRGRNDNWILSSPRFRFLPSYAYFVVLISSLWPLIVVALPMLLAVKAVFGLGILATTLTLISMTLLVAFSVAAALLLILALGVGVYAVTSLFSRPRVSLGLVAMGTLLLFIGISYLAWESMVDTDIVELFRAQDVAAPSADIAPIMHQFRFVPSHLTALTLFSSQHGNMKSAFAPVGILALLFLSTALLFRVLSRWYLPVWQSFQEGRFEAKIGVRGVSPGVCKFPRIFVSPLGALFEKEALMMIRDYRNLMWLGFLSFLWFLQTGLNVFLRRNMARYEVEPGAILHIVQALQIIAIVYFIGAFVLRFAFPSFSTERRTAWILAASPLDLGKVFLAKFFFWAFVLSILGIFVGILNASILDIEFVTMWAFLLFTTITIVTVSAFGLALGAVFPNFETDDPQVLSTSLPGLAFILLSLLYGGIAAKVLYDFLEYHNVIELILYEALSVLATAFFVYLPPRFLRKLEFIAVRE